MILILIEDVHLEPMVEVLVFLVTLEVEEDQIMEQVVKEENVGVM